MRKNRPKHTYNRSINLNNWYLRVIGGVWRSRRIYFPELPEIRPTPDRVRETLFNWLQPIIPGTICLDLFAGSGALGFEATSRGAASVTMVDKNPRIIHQLRLEAKRLDAKQTEIIRADALSWLQATSRSFDIVFLDPPFGQGLLGKVINILADHNRLRVDSRIYIETEAEYSVPYLPADWTIARAKRAGQVKYYLVIVKGKKLF